MTEILIDNIIYILDKLGYLGVFLGMLLESMCIPIPSEIILPFGGYLSYTGRLSIIYVIVMGTLGGVTGSILAYFIGEKGGRPLVDKYAYKLKISPSRIKQSETAFNKYGEKIVFYSRLLPIIRTFISLPAGMAKMNFSKFVIYTAVGSLIWTIALVYAGNVMGQNWSVIRSWFHILDILMVIGVIALLLYKILGKKSIKKV